MVDRSRFVHWMFLLAVAFSATGVVSVWPTEAHAQAPDREFTIAVGETLTFNARGVRRVTVGLSDIADTKPTRDGRQLILVGKSRGVTTINIYSDKGQKTLLVRVVGVNPQSLAQEVRKVMGKGSGVDVRVVKGRVLLEGEVSSETFKKKIKRLTELYPQQILNFTTFREAFVEGAKMVAVDIYFIQMAVTKSDDLGVSWGEFVGGNFSFGSGDVPLYYEPEDTSSGVLPGMDSQNILSEPATLAGGSGLNSYWSLIGNLNLTLDFLTEHGMVKTIQHGMIVTEAGKEAEYHNGGQLLIKLESFGGAQLREVPYGLNVKVKPVVDFQNQVKLKLDVEMSRLDYANSIGDVPSLQDTEIQTTINMQQGQSVLVTTQDNHENTSNENGFWLLSRVPILGWLFKSRNFIGRRLDNALFVTPKVYEPGSQQHKTLVQGVFKQLLDEGAEPDDLPELSSSPGNTSGSGSNSSGSNGGGDLLDQGSSSSKSSSQ